MRDHGRGVGRWEGGRTGWIFRLSELDQSVESEAANNGDAKASIGQRGTWQGLSRKGCQVKWA